ncbi:hypothetical protein PICSAR144_03483 [Mycobacterium avium subsp. paratuberculosis]|nr:hypothetical protein PICSAR144_03483 [Mycobacterium avium subsp. paratuberculosis]
MPLRQLRGVRMPGQERRQVRAHRHRPHPRPAAAVRDAERLVQVQVADVAAELARPGQPDQRVEVGAVDVHLAARVVDGRADLGDVVLVDAVRGRVGDHQRRQPVAVFGDLRAQVVEVDVAVVVAAHDHHPHPGQGRRRGIRAVRAGRDEADVAVRFPAAGVVVVDGQQAGVLALRPGVGLQRDGVVAGDGHQPVLQVADEPAQPRRVGRRGEGVLTCELRPGDRLHLGGGVEFHGARAEWNHAAVQRNILVGQGAQVAHHRRLGAVLGEGGMGKEFRSAGSDFAGDGLGGCDAERLEHRGDVFVGGGLVAGHRDVVVVDPPQVDAPGLGRGDHLVGPARHPRQHGVEVPVVHHRGAQRGRDRLGVPVHAACDRGQPLSAVVAGVHGGHHRQQHLRGADVAGRLVAADVLLAGLQRQPVGRRTVGVQRDTDQPARQLPGVVGVHRQVSRVRAAESHWHTESLGGAEGHVGADLAGRGDQGQGQQVGAERHQRAALVRLRHQGGPIGDRAAGAGQLGDDAEEVAVGQPVAQVGGDDLDAQRPGPGGHDGRGLGEHVGVHRQPVGLAARCAAHQRHRLGSRGALVEHRGVGDLEAGQIGHHGLEVQQRLQPALADLRLIRRVGGVPGGVLQDVAQQHRRGQRVVVALPDHGHGDGVGLGQAAQLGQRLGFAGRRRQPVQARRDPVGREPVADAGRNGLGGQLVQRADTDDVEHGRDGLRVRADVPGGESGVVGHGKLLTKTLGARTAVLRWSSSSVFTRSPGA